MAQTYFGSTVRAGSGTLTDTVDGGFMVLTQTTTATTLADGSAVTSTITIPADSQIINFFIDCTTTPVVGGGTATAVNATIGTAAAGTQYLSATDVIAGGRASLSFTAAQLTAMEDVNANTTVAFTIDPNGTVSTTQGVYRLTVVYAQKV
jgi:uncharacterized membrane protein